MAEYIDREEIKEWISAWLKEDKDWHPYSKGKNIPTVEVFDILSRIPAVDVQPVRHGRWDVIDPYNCLHGCTNCGWLNLYMKFDYCPNCGARMDGEV